MFAQRFSRRNFLGLAVRDSGANVGDSIETGVSYDDFLEIFADRRYNVCPVVEYDSSYNPDKVNVLLRHDMDSDNGYGMLELDYNQGIRSTSYLRLHADVFYKIGEVTKFFQLMEKSGFEVGYHYEVVDLTMKGSQIDWVAAESLFAEELNFMRKSFSVRSVSPHGGSVDKPSRNVEFEKDESRLGKYGVFSAYKIPFSKPVPFYYLSDTSSTFMSDGLGYFKEELGKTKAGDVVEILVHPQIGRWNYKFYPNEVLPELITRTFQIPTTSTTNSPSSSDSATSSIRTTTTMLPSTQASTSLSTQTTTAANSVLGMPWEYLLPSAALCTLGALAFYKFHERKIAIRSSQKLCANCGRAMKSGHDFCDKCLRPIA